MNLYHVHSDVTVLSTSIGSLQLWWWLLSDLPVNFMKILGNYIRSLWRSSCYFFSKLSGYYNFKGQHCVSTFLHTTWSTANPIIDIQLPIVLVYIMKFVSLWGIQGEIYWHLMMTYNMETLSRLLAHCEGLNPLMVDFPHDRWIPLTKGNAIFRLLCFLCC